MRNPLLLLVVLSLSFAGRAKADTVYYNTFTLTNTSETIYFQLPMGASPTSFFSEAFPHGPPYVQLEYDPVNFYINGSLSPESGGVEIDSLHGYFTVGLVPSIVPPPPPFINFIVSNSSGYGPPGPDGIPTEADIFWTGSGSAPVFVDGTFTSPDGKTTITIGSTEPAASSVPEPSALVLLGTGAVGLVEGIRRRRRC